jgi:hypothetical protein
MNTPLILQYCLNAYLTTNKHNNHNSNKEKTKMLIKIWTTKINLGQQAGGNKVYVGTTYETKQALVDRAVAHFNGLTGGNCSVDIRRIFENNAQHIVVDSRQVGFKYYGIWYYKSKNTIACKPFISVLGGYDWKKCIGESHCPKHVCEISEITEQQYNKLIGCPNYSQKVNMFSKKQNFQVA